jgi:hypothetical protein
VEATCSSAVMEKLLTPGVMRRAQPHLLPVIYRHSHPSMVLVFHRPPHPVPSASLQPLVSIRLVTTLSWTTQKRVVKGLLLFRSASYLNYHKNVSDLNIRACFVSNKALPYNLTHGSSTLNTMFYLLLARIISYSLTDLLITLFRDLRRSWR